MRTVATAAIRGAANRDEFVEVVGERGGVEVTILEGEEEARLAFLGATRTLGHALEGVVGVVDVGGGSTEIAVGTVAGGVTWWASFRLGSGHLADEYLRSDPPSAARAARRCARTRPACSAALDVPRPDAAVAVGGSAASLRRLVGAVLEPDDAAARAAACSSEAPAAEVAERFALDPQRVRLLPAGMLILDAAAHSARLPADDRPRRPARGRAARAGAGGMIGGRAMTDVTHRTRDAPRSISTTAALYFNRELSWLQFNARVLELAEDAERRRCSSA